MKDKNHHGFIVKSPSGTFEVYSAAKTKEWSIRMMEDETLEPWVRLQGLGYTCVPFRVQLVPAQHPCVIVHEQSINTHILTNRKDRNQ